MSKLEELYKSKINSGGDIGEHVETLYKYAKECESIIEMGTRDGCSIYAFAAAKPKKLVNIDVAQFGGADGLKEACTVEGVDYEFWLKSTLEVEIPEVDLLFIDTEHSYLQLRAELAIHGNKANKYLIFHDTNTFGHTDSSSYGDGGLRYKEGEEHKTGLIPALNEFLEANPHWVRHEVFENNNGLTILKRK
jgi:hypothetical protein